MMKFPNRDEVLVKARTGETLTPIEEFIRLYEPSYPGASVDFRRLLRRVIASHNAGVQRTPPGPPNLVPENLVHCAIKSVLTNREQGRVMGKLREAGLLYDPRSGDPAINPVVDVRNNGSDHEDDSVYVRCDGSDKDYDQSGWQCTRREGHSGPCALVRAGGEITPDKLAPRAPEQLHYGGRAGGKDGVMDFQDRVGTSLTKPYVMDARIPNGIIRSKHITHEKKLTPSFYSDVAEGRKTFECRLNDCDYQCGDTIKLCEWDDKTENFTGKSLTFTIGTVLYGPAFGLSPDWCAFALLRDPVVLELRNGVMVTTSRNGTTVDYGNRADIDVFRANGDLAIRFGAWSGKDEKR